MALCEKQRLRTRTASLVTAVLLAIGGHMHLGASALAETPLAENESWLSQQAPLRPAGVGPSRVGLSLAAASQPLPLPNDRDEGWSTPVAYAAPASAFMEKALLGAGFPKVFERNIKRDTFGWRGFAENPRLQAINLPTHGDSAIVPTLPVRRAASSPRNALHDSLLFALIFKDGQGAWSEQELASMVAGHGAVGVAGDAAATCDRIKPCGLSSAPVPGALWLFTALLIGFFGVGYRRQRPQG